MKWLLRNFLLILSVASHPLYAQSNAPAQDTAVTDSVYLQAFQQMQIFQSDTNTRYVLVGDVILSADSNLFFCDSLIFDSDIDSGVIRAYNNIQVTTIEGIVITSDSLVYSLETSAGRFLGHCTYTENGKRIKSPYISFNTATAAGTSLSDRSNLACTRSISVVTGLSAFAFSISARAPSLSPC